MVSLNSFLSNSLFSTIVTFYILIFLYFPSPLFFYLISSPILISTIVLLLFLLELGATQTCATKKNESIHEDKDSINHDPILKHEIIRERVPDHNPAKFYFEQFIEWDVRAPLDVIYEEHEGEEEAEENKKVYEEKRDLQTSIIEKYASLSSYYPESDTDDSSEGDLPTWNSSENMFFQWEDGLIEIALDDQKKYSEVEEDNMIEINLFPER